MEFGLHVLRQYRRRHRLPGAVPGLVSSCGSGAGCRTSAPADWTTSTTPFNAGRTASRLSAGRFPCVTGRCPPTACWWSRSKASRSASCNPANG